jgi:E3 ubiquitin-protein ligase UBR4
MLDALFGILDSTIRAPHTGYSLQLLGLIRLLAGNANAAAFLQVRGAVPFLCHNLRAEAHRLRNAEQDLLREPFKLAVISDVDSVLPRWLAEVLQSIVTASPRARILFVEKFLDKTLEAIVLMKDIMLSYSPHVDSALGIIQKLVVQGDSAPGAADPDSRKRQFLVAGMRVLDQAWASSPTPVSDSTAGFLVAQMNEVIKPPQRRPDFRIQFRRAPTQEDFFRGALPKNPIRYSDLTSASPEAGAAVTMDVDGSCNDDDAGPRMSDVRRKIAKDLDMQDAEELLELLVCNQIISPSLHVALVHSQIWRPYVLDADSGYASDCEPDVLPPILITYRLAGVDGEATEELVESLEDPKSRKDTDPEVEFAITTSINSFGGLESLLRGTDQQCRRMKMLGVESHGSELFMQCLSLLHACTHVSSNCEALARLHAPGTMVHCLVELLKSEEHRFTREIDKLLVVIEPLMQWVSSNENAALLEDNEAAGPKAVTTTMAAADHLRVLLDGLHHRSVVTLLEQSETLRHAVVRLLPFLIYGRPDLAKDLCTHMSRTVDWLRLEEELQLEQPVPLHVQCLLEAASKVGDNASSKLFCQHLLEAGFTDGTVDAIQRGAPADETEQFLWTEFSRRPILPKAIEVLTGMCRVYEATALRTFERGVLPLLHRLEDLPGEAGLQAEVLLELLSAGPEVVASEVARLRKETKQRRREISEKQRQRALQAMGFKVPGTVAPSAVDTESTSEDSSVNGKGKGKGKAKTASDSSSSSRSSSSSKSQCWKGRSRSKAGMDDGDGGYGRRGRAYLHGLPGRICI